MIAPEIYRVVTDMEALHEAFRDRVEDLNVSRIELDAAAGFTPGYASKLLCDPPMKFVGKETLAKMLKGTGLAIALVVDDGKLPKAEQRKYKIGRIRAAAASIEQNVQETPVSLEQLVREHMRNIGAKGNANGAASNGGKRRAKAMKARARQRAASHAARMRWSKAKREVRC